MKLSRRLLLQVGSGAAAAAALPAAVHSRAFAEDELPDPIRALQPGDDDIEPISLDERRARLVRAQGLMAEHRLDALVVASGSSLVYFTGARWGNSERFFGMVLTRRGNPAWVTPAFERERASEQIQIGEDVRAWQEHESPYALIASILADRGVTGARIGIEETMRFVFASGIGDAAPAAELRSGTPVTAGCRMIKDAHELAIMRRANQKTVAAHRAVFQSLAEGMTQREVAGLSSAAHSRLGMRGGSLVLFGKDAAYPHGTTRPQPLRAGDFVLIDGGGSFLDYSSDITRTGVFGAKASDRQREIWEVVRRAQQAAFEAIRPGVECQAIDAAARRVLADAGFGADYEHLTHRLGHGIGMDGHEWTYLVRGNNTKLEPGMCFSDEPGIYVYGEMGVRHEDIVHVTEDGAANMTKWSGSPEDPAVV
ncbi:MAG TPA: Xaa-Pro peptidase family protein [Thermoanaerobaculia bacterium]|nr:Xaa-Pro peptidase family protein [Thermoanaerobaculia bacterium]